jgi:hypothetical protein
MNRFLVPLALAFLGHASAQLTPSVHPHLLEAGSGIPTSDGLEFVVESSTKVTLHGFAGFAYVAGNRISDANGDDQLGNVIAALETDVEFENFKFVGVLGGSIFSGQPADTGFKDLFLVWNAIGGTDFTARAGAQALLFGLKPAGFPGDRSLESSLEFGGAGAFAVSNQAGPSVIVEHPLAGLGRLEVAVFDTSATTSGTAGSLDGSGVYRNFFAQARLEHLGLEGLYGVLGYEGRYVGQTSGGTRVDSTEPILVAGLGFASERFDLSLELQTLDENIAETADTESYTIAELTVFASESLTAFLDFADADELGNSTLRLGGILDMNAHASFQLEFAHDEIDGASDASSVQGRITFGF